MVQRKRTTFNRIPNQGFEKSPCYDCATLEAIEAEVIEFKASQDADEYEERLRAIRACMCENFENFVRHEQPSVGASACCKRDCMARSGVPSCRRNCERYSMAEETKADNAKLIKKACDAEDIIDDHINARALKATKRKNLP